MRSVWSSRPAAVCTRRVEKDRGFGPREHPRGILRRPGGPAQGDERQLGGDRFDDHGCQDREHDAGVAGTFKGSVSIRTRLYRIATDRSLDALRSTRRPQNLEPSTDPPTPSRMTEPIWLEPYPDAPTEGIADEAAGPDACYDQREALALAFVTGLQHLHPQQRRSWSTRRARVSRGEAAATWTQAKPP